MIEGDFYEKNRIFSRRNFPEIKKNQFFPLKENLSIHDKQGPQLVKNCHGCKKKPIFPDTDDGFLRKEEKITTNYESLKFFLLRNPLIVWKKFPSLKC